MPNRQVAADAIRKTRTDLRRRRQAFVGDGRYRAERAIRSHVSSLLGVIQPPLVSAYLHCDGEVDLTGTIADIHASTSELALPGLVADGDRFVMDFRRFHDGDELRVGAYDIVEPADGAVVDASELSVVLAALVAFDATGARIGRGGGHYDRSFGPLRRKPDRPLLVGVAFEFQRVGTIATRDHDVGMDVMITELGIRWTGSHPEIGIEG